MKNLRGIKAYMKEALEKDGLTNIIELELIQSDITSTDEDVKELLKLLD